MGWLGQSPPRSRLHRGCPTVTGPSTGLDHLGAVLPCTRSLHFTVYSRDSSTNISCLHPLLTVWVEAWGPLKRERNQGQGSAKRPRRRRFEAMMVLYGLSTKQREQAKLVGSGTMGVSLIFLAATM